jgi:RIO-like serine/threonine protein kinase
MMKFSDFEIISVLKEDVFGTVSRVGLNGDTFVCRNYSRARNIFTRAVAYILARREAAILRKASPIGASRIPKLLYFGNGILCRTYIPGKSLRVHQNPDASFYVDARRLLEELHGLGIIHNDLQKPENWLVTESGGAAIIDFQLAVAFKNPQNRLFTIGKLEDIRHLYKNKKRFYAQGLSDEELHIINSKHPVNKIFMDYFKPVYDFITRKVLRYTDHDNSRFSR